MYCCGETVVIETRKSAEGIRRRRQCECGRRFTTLEVGFKRHGGHIRYTKEIREMVKEDYHSGMKPKEIWRKWGIPQSTINGWIYER